MTSTARFDNWQNRLGTQAGSIDASGNVTFDNDVTVTGGATVSGDLAVTGNVTSANQGLVLVKTQTIGTSVTSVTVTNAFSSAFSNYRIVISGVTSSVGGSVPRLRLGSTTTGYYNGMLIQGYGGTTPSPLGVTNGSNWYIMGGTTVSQTMSVTIDIYQPNLATRTTFTANGTYDGNVFMTGGQQLSTTQFTDFSLLPDGVSTITGGTIRVYGYNNG
jgi:hypothetical protein